MDDTLRDQFDKLFIYKIGDRVCYGDPKEFPQKLMVIDRHLVQTPGGFVCAYSASGFSCGERRLQMVLEIELSRPRPDTN